MIHLNHFFYLLIFWIIFLINSFLVCVIFSDVSIWSSHFSERSIAIGLVASIFARIILIITMIGTDKSIQTTHHKAHQNDSDIIIASGLRLSLFHINLGSITFHISTWIHIRPAEINTNG